jgi:hypothetical protein
MVLKTALIFLVILILMEDGLSIKKKTREEEEEDEKIAEMVNITLAEEEKKQKEEGEKKEKATEKKNEGEKKKKDRETGSGRKDEDEASPSVNITSPEVKPCIPCKDCENCKDCPPEKECGSCPPVKPCKQCKECGQCPEVEQCAPCGPCPVANTTSNRPPTVDACPEPAEASMPTAVAISVGAVASLLLTGVAAALGLLLRYASPFESGFAFLATIIIMWYLCSRYPEAARELGERVVATLRDATIALGHRVAEAIQRHSNQVGFSVSVLFFLLPD